MGCVVCLVCTTKCVPPNQLPGEGLADVEIYWASTGRKFYSQEDDDMLGAALREMQRQFEPVCPVKRRASTHSCNSHFAH